MEKLIWNEIKDEDEYSIDEAIGENLKFRIYYRTSGFTLSIGTKYGKLLFQFSENYMITKEKDLHITDPKRFAECFNAGIILKTVFEGDPSFNCNN